MPLTWLLQHYIEVLGAVTGLIYLYFSIRRNIWLWPVGIVTSAFYVYIFFQSKFYADMGLQVYYFFISFYGWHKWVKAKGNDGKVKISKADITQLSLYIILTLIITIIISYILINYTDSPLPVWDAFTTAGSILATWMLARKILENWLFWIIIDLISMGLYFYKGLYPTVLLFFVYSFMAVVGYIQWKKSLSEESGIPEKL